MNDLTATVYAYLDNELTDAQRRTLEAWLDEDPRHVDQFVAECHFHSQIHDLVSERDVQAEAMAVQGDAVSRYSPAPLPPVVIQTLPSSISAFPSYFGVALFSYMIATLVMGAALTVAWVWKRPETPQIVQQTNSPGNQRPGPSVGKAQYVGHVAGMADCVWEGSGFRVQGSDHRSKPLHQNSLLQAGDRIALKSGLLEIVYDTGASVILQGPVAYEIESAAGGFLSRGKLTARLEKKSEVGSQRSVPVNQKSESRKRTFAVRTPTAIVTDLGTEFGVEVRDGLTDAHVFRGAIEVEAVDNRSGPAKAVRLDEHDSIRVQLDANKTASVSRVPIGAKTFVRRLPRQVPVRIYSTGANLAPWAHDPHWEVVSVTSDLRFQPRLAIVARVTPGDWLPNDPARSQWISPVLDGGPAPNNATYTFRTTFDLTGMRPDTAVLGGWFIADSYIRAMRINGHDVMVPEHRREPPHDLFRRFTIASGFVEGMNVLEIDVENAEADDTTGSSPIGLRMELEGRVREK